MPHYTRYYNNESENLKAWAENNLSPEELDDFNSAYEENSAMWKTYADNGMINFVPIISQVYIEEIGESVDVEVGNTVTIAPGYTAADVTITPRWLYWVRRIPPNLFTDQLTFVQD